MTLEVILNPMKIVISASASLLITFSGWLCAEFSEVESIFFYVGLYTLAPGLIVGGIFKGMWQIIHDDKNMLLVYLINFLIYFFLFLLTFKIFGILLRWFKRESIRSQ